MKTTIFLALFSTLTPFSLGLFQCTVNYVVYTSDEVHITESTRTVTFAVDKDTADYLGGYFDKECQIKKVGILNCKVFLKTEGQGSFKTIGPDGVEKYHVKFTYERLAIVENSDELTLQAFRQKALAVHKINRKKHGVINDLELDDELNEIAQRNANSIASIRTAKYSALVGHQGVEFFYSELGDNILVGSDAGGLIQEWYDVGNLLYDFGLKDLSENNPSKCCRYTSMLWEGTNKMGAGVAYVKGTKDGTPFQETYIVTRYNGGHYGWTHQLLSANVKNPIS